MLPSFLGLLLGGVLARTVLWPFNLAQQRTQGRVLYERALAQHRQIVEQVERERALTQRDRDREPVDGVRA